MPDMVAEWTNHLGRIYLPACLSACLPVCFSVCLPACMSTCLPACVSVCLFSCLPGCLPVFLLHACKPLRCVIEGVCGIPWRWLVNNGAISIPGCLLLLLLIIIIIIVVVVVVIIIIIIQIDIALDQ